MKSPVSTVVRLVNTTTSLRVDDTVEKGFFEVIDPAFMIAIENQSGQDYVDVQLARRGAPHGGIQRVPDTDALGIYIPHSRLSHHHAIKIFPERVLAACLPWLRAMAEAGCALACEKRFPTLLYKVIIHELAHYLMDDRVFSDQHCRWFSWAHYVRLMENHATDQASNDDEKCEEFVNFKRKYQIHKCRVKTESIQRWRKKKVSLHEQCRFVEESLANAFVLRQNFGDRLEPIRVFINSQSEVYKCGLKWRGNLKELLDMASEWRRFKSTLIRREDTSQQEASLTQLIERLKKSGVDLPFRL